MGMHLFNFGVPVENPASRKLRAESTVTPRLNISRKVTFIACSLGLLPPVYSHAVSLRKGI